jgi:hypothetical protein
MGWWKTGGTENIIGDGPLDAIGDAVLGLVGAALGDQPNLVAWQSDPMADVGAVGGTDSIRSEAPSQCSLWSRRSGSRGTFPSGASGSMHPRTAAPRPDETRPTEARPAGAPAPRGRQRAPCMGV